MISIPIWLLVLLVLVTISALTAAAISIALGLRVLTHLGTVNVRIDEMVAASARFAEAQGQLNASQQAMNAAISDHLAAQRTINDGLSFFLVRRGPDRKPG